MPKQDERIYVKPGAGLKVRNPQKLNEHLPTEGDWVARDSFFRRRLKDGDVVEATAPRPPRAPKPAAAKQED
jgi:hypothetical protein